jgi:hypothetical protein
MMQQLNELANILPSDFADDARVWIFQSNRSFNENESDEINEQLFQFYTQWQTHGSPVKGWATLLFAQFVLVIADETKHGVSGCSTDSMMRIIKSFENQYQVNLFDRLTITFLVNGRAEQLPMQQIKYALSTGFIETDTPLFNNTISTKAMLQKDWLQPLNKSWLWAKICE